MKDLSLHLLDIVQNSVKAGASLINITLRHEGDMLSMTVEDNGCGMSKELLERVLDPFTTTRTTRKVGLGLPLLKQAAEQTGGSLHIQSREGEGTALSVMFNTEHIDSLPLGDIPSTIVTLLQGSPDIDFVYRHIKGEGESSLDTREMRGQLGGVPLDTPEVLEWAGESLRESESALI